MAFLSKVGNILRQTASRQIGSEISASRPSLYQGIRCMSSSKVFIGGISYQTDEAGLREAFDKYGSVLEAKIIVDRETGRSRGFGFVTYSSQEEASSAIQALDGQDLHGRRVRVNFATERPPRTYNNSYGNYGGGGYGGGGYGTGGGYGGGGYGSGGNYGGGGYGSNDGNYSGGNVSSYGGGGGGDGNYAGGNTYDNVPGNYGVAGGSGGDVPGNYGVAGGGGGGGVGNENYASTSSDGGFGYGGGDQFGANDNSAPGGGVNQDALDSSYKDDDDTGDFAKRA